MADRNKCTICGLVLPTHGGQLILSSWPEFDLRHSICADAFWAMVDASSDPQVVRQFLDSQGASRSQLAHPRAWHDLDPETQFEFENWIIAALKARSKRCADQAA